MFFFNVGNHVKNRQLTPFTLPVVCLCCFLLWCYVLCHEGTGKRTAIWRPVKMLLRLLYCIFYSNLSFKLNADWCSMDGKLFTRQHTELYSITQDKGWKLFLIPRLLQSYLTLEWTLSHWRQKPDVSRCWWGFLSSVKWAAQNPKRLLWYEMFQKCWHFNLSIS